jgi:hypothetical protein
LWPPEWDGLMPQVLHCAVLLVAQINDVHCLPGELEGQWKHLCAGTSAYSKCKRKHRDPYFRTHLAGWCHRSLEV